MAYKSCFDPPEAHAGHDPFRIGETTAYGAPLFLAPLLLRSTLTVRRVLVTAGRMRISQQVASHNHIVSQVRACLPLFCKP